MTLTEVERQVAELVARGWRNDEVARELHLSGKTIEWNLTKIYRKLRVRSRTELAAAWRLVGPESGFESRETPGEPASTYSASGRSARPPDSSTKGTT